MQPAQPTIRHLDRIQGAIHCQNLKSYKIIMYLEKCNNSQGGSAWEVVRYWASGFLTEKGLLTGPDAGAGQDSNAPEAAGPRQVCCCGPTRTPGLGDPGAAVPEVGTQRQEPWVC